MVTGLAVEASTIGVTPTGLPVALLDRWFDRRRGIVVTLALPTVVPDLANAPLRRSYAIGLLTLFARIGRFT